MRLRQFYGIKCASLKQHHYLCNKEGNCHHGKEPITNEQDPMNRRKVPMVNPHGPRKKEHILIQSLKRFYVKKILAFLIFFESLDLLLLIHVMVTQALGLHASFVLLFIAESAARNIS